MKLKPTFWMIFAALLLAGCNVSLAADVTPPPDFSPTRPADQPAVMRTAMPMVPPDPANGAAIFADKCTPCHGETGLSDGPMAPQLPAPAPMLGSADVARAAVPADWFAMVTNGNLERLMPGFSASLGERERWDVVAYALNLHVSAAELARGQVIYDQECQACHGPQGEGDGPQAGGEVPDWKADQARLARASSQELWEIISAGLPPAMPGYANELSEDERWAVTAYVRSLSFAAPAELTAQAGTPAAGQPTPPAETDDTPPAPAQPAEDTPDGLSSISGQVKNLSGGSLPADLEVTLTGYDGMQEVTAVTAPVAADGGFAFEEVEAVSGRVYLAAVEYGGVTYNADVIHPDQLLAGKDVQGVNIELYEVTTDASTLRADRMHVFFEQTPEGRVQVVQLFILNNQGQKVIVPAGEDEPVIRVRLPEGATNLQFQDGVIGQNYTATADGFGDLHTFMPGAGSQLMFAYELPLARKVDLSLEAPLPVESSVLMAPVGGLLVSGEQISEAGVRTMQDMDVRLYTAGRMEPGSNLEVTLSTVPAAASLLQNASTVGVVAGGVGLGLVLLGAGMYLARRRRQAAFEEEGDEDGVVEEFSDRESLLDAIIALDDQYRTGQLPEEVYQQRRSELKERLRAMTEDQA